MRIQVEIAEVVLWATIEDYAGLWELLWEVNTKFPEVNRKSVLLEVMQLLLNKGYIKLYTCQEPFGEPSELDIKRAHAALVEAKNWEAPDFDGFSIRAGATELGEDLYESNAVAKLYS